MEVLEDRLAPATFMVNTTLDAVATNFKTGQDAMGQISLRSAIMAADARGGHQTIKLPSGTFTLTIPRAGEDNSATGDLDVKGNLTIKGTSPAATVVDNTSITGNHASTNDNDVDGTVSP